jgi:hypothetical protein
MDAKRGIIASTTVGAWRRLVAHLPWAQGVGGSNPLAPTTQVKLRAIPFTSTGIGDIQRRNLGTQAPVAQLDRATDF